MKNVLKFYYDIIVDKYTVSDEEYYFEYNNNYYMFIPNRRNSSLDINFLKEYELYDQYTYKIVFDKYNDFEVEYNNQKYVLLWCDYDYDTCIFLDDLLKNNGYVGDTSYVKSWGQLWSERNNFYESQIHEYGKKNKLIYNSFSYYYYMAENAIAYINNSEKLYAEKEKEYSIVRRKMEYPIKRKQFLNPLNYIVDLKVRDYAEYIKNIFFFDDIENHFDDVHIIIKNIKATSYNYSMFFARLLYPNYYFNEYDKIINYNKSSDKMNVIVNKSEEYKLFLNDIYKYLAKIKPIDKIDWL